MTQIINAATGETVGYTEAPRYIRRSQNGSLVQTDAENAEGVAFRGTPYNLRGREGVSAEDTVFLTEQDSGEVLSDLIEIAPLVACENVPAGKYFTVGSRTFLATLSIPAGEAVEPGVNCKEVSVSEALNALNN